MWDKETGRPVYPAIVWQCRRTAPMIDAVIKDGMADKITDITGLIPDAYFSATKIKWILDNVHGAREAAKTASYFSAQLIHGLYGILQRVRYMQLIIPMRHEP